VAGPAVAARAVDLFQDERCLHDAEAGAAVLLRDEDGEIARLGQVVDERVGVLALGVQLAPVLARVLLAQVVDRRLERLLIVGEREAHILHAYFP